jgi:hypothetical protein
MQRMLVAIISGLEVCSIGQLGGDRSACALFLDANFQIKRGNMIRHEMSQDLANSVVPLRKSRNANRLP